MAAVAIDADTGGGLNAPIAAKEEKHLEPCSRPVRINIISEVSLTLIFFQSLIKENVEIERIEFEN